jgi:hypothetical protein
LRIVERLLKNAASFVYQHSENKVRLKKLKELAKLVETRLKRKRFNITVGKKEESKTEATLPTDEVFIGTDRELGENIGPLIKSNIHIKMSALTGAQAVRILQDKQFYEAIVATTEGKVSPRSLSAILILSLCPRPLFLQNLERQRRLGGSSSLGGCGYFLSTLHGSKGLENVCRGDLSAGEVPVHPPTLARRSGAGRGCRKS